MAFWGVEIESGKPYIHRSDNDKARLHLSQATLGTGPLTKKSIVQCQVGDKKPIFLCSLLPQKVENCALNLEYEEDDEVTFSVDGPHSVHLSGFFYGDDEDQDNLGDDYESDPCCEEDIMGMDSEDEDDSIDYDSEDEDEDEYIDDDFGVYPPSPVPNSGVRIEEIVDEEKPTDENAKRAKKKKTQSTLSDDNVNSNRQIVSKARTGVPEFESEDEDGFPVAAHGNKSDISITEAALQETKNKKTGAKAKKSEKPDAAPGKNLKRKSDVSLDERPARETTEPHGSSVHPDTLAPENEVKQKKNKKKRVAESSLENGMADSNSKNESIAAEFGNDPKPPANKKEKKKKKKNKQQENAPTPNAEGNQSDDNGSVMEKQEKTEAKSLKVRSFPNGLVIEKLVMGKPDGKRATPGKKVTVRYIGKLKKNGKIFDSNIGKAPFKFRLGIGQVIKGWDVGVNGMRIGDKRMLTIPPAMGYGAKGVGTIPPNSWLVFDVELVDVN